MNKFNIQNKDLLSGINIIDASAGTGKTFSMALIVLKLILEKDPPINIDQILAVTFTKAATHELKARIRSFIRIAYEYTEAVLKNKTYDHENTTLTSLVDSIGNKKDVLKKLNYALLWLDEAPIFTIHSFCQRTIKEYAFELNAPFDPSIVTDQHEIEEEIFNDLTRKEIHEESQPKPPAFEHFLNTRDPDHQVKAGKLDKIGLAQKIEKLEGEYNGELSEELIQLYEQRELLLAEECQKKIEELIAKRKEEDNILTYDDLVDTLFKAVDNPKTLEFLRKSLSSKYKAVMIDEFQDTDSKQVAIFKSIFEGTESPLIFIGDPKQSIYAFRGAEVDVYNKIANSLPPHNRHTLDTNYRAAPGMVEAVNNFFTTKPICSDLIGAEIIDLKFDTKNLKHKLEDDEKMCGEIVCLYQPLEAIHLDKTITKYQIIKKGNASEGARAAVIGSVTNEIARLLKGVKPSEIAVLVRTNEQADSIKGALDQRGIPCVTWSNSNVFTKPEAIDVVLLARAMAVPSNPAFIRAALFGEIIGFNNLDEIEKNEGLWLTWVERFRQYHEKWNKQGFFSAFTHIVNTYCKNKIIRKENGLRKITNLMHIAELVLKDLGVKEYTPQAVLKYLDAKLSNPSLEADEYMVRLETEEDVVNIMTVHKSKGLEFPIVFIPFAWTFKDNELIDPTPEDTRLLYVAITRAKSRAYINWGKIKASNRSALGKILYDGLDEESFRNLDDSYILQSLKTLFSYVHIASAKDVSDHKIQLAPPKLVVEKIKSFKKDLAPGFSIYSYTSLAHKEHQRKRYLDFDEEVTTKQPPKQEQLLPLGARTGIIIHSIFEELDFENADVRLETMDLNADSVKELVHNTLEQALDDKGLKLKQISRDQRISEMEFCFSLNKAALKNKDLIKGIAGLNIDIDDEGFIKGFMDLVFRHNGKYYILDWKTNYLGDSGEAYSSENLAKSMEQNNYNLQYLLYTVALNLYLSKMISGYNYETDFGGVYYLFLRGISGSDKKEGVFFNRPEKDVIYALTKYLTGVEDGQ